MTPKGEGSRESGGWEIFEKENIILWKIIEKFNL